MLQTLLEAEERAINNFVNFQADQVHFKLARLTQM